MDGGPGWQTSAHVSPGSSETRPQQADRTPAPVGVSHEGLTWGLAPGRLDSARALCPVIADLLLLSCNLDQRSHTGRH